MRHCYCSAWIQTYFIKWIVLCSNPGRKVISDPEIHVGLRKAFETGRSVCKVSSLYRKIMILVSEKSRNQVHRDNVGKRFESVYCGPEVDYVTVVEIWTVVNFYLYVSVCEFSGSHSWRRVYRSRRNCTGMASLRYGHGYDWQVCTWP